MGRWIVLLGVVVLAGCASSTPPSRLDYAGHLDKAQSWVGLQRCIEQGNLSPEISALGVRYFEADLGSYAYNQKQLDDLVNQAYGYIPRVDASYCNKVAAAVAGQKQEIDMHNAWVDQNRQALQNQINQINQNRPVICNRVGTYTMCQ